MFGRLAGQYLARKKRVFLGFFIDFVRKKLQKHENQTKE
jgi:hypothetical protein